MMATRETSGKVSGTRKKQLVENIGTNYINLPPVSTLTGREKKSTKSLTSKDTQSFSNQLKKEGILEL